jgi:DNA-directed RNA polymerase beta subunit/intein/homing endonuclease
MALVNTDNLTYDKIFDLLDCRFARKNVLYEHLHNSYNDMVNQIINYLEKNKNIFEENRVGDKIYRYRFKYENIHVRPPLNENGDSLMYPMDARDRNSTYSIKFIAKISQIQEIYDLTKKEIISEKVLGTPYEKETAVIIPNMVRSRFCSLEISKDYNQRECSLDPGGYFIVNGSEKIVLSIEKMVENKPLVFIKKDAGINNYEVKINSRSNDPNVIPQGIQIKLKKDFDISIKVPILNEVSVFVLMRALGLETDKEIIKYIVYNEDDIDMLNILKISIDLSKKDGKKLILTKEDAYYSLTNKLRVVKKYIDKDRKLQYEEKKEHLESLFRGAFMPHINSDKFDDPLKVKAIFLGYMINKLLNCYLGRTKPDDRDSFVNKRIDMPGDLIFDLFKQYYKKMLNECNKFFKKRSGGNHETPLVIISQIKPSIIEQGIKSAMLTGNWGKKKGVAQMYPRLTYLQSSSFLRRVDAPSADSTASKLTGPRHYHPSQAGFLCLVGDTEILMSDGTVKLIKDIKNGDSVVSIDKKTLTEVSTPIKNWFKKDCDKLLKLTTMTGREIKCTPEHKMLTKIGDRYDFVEVQNMKEGDYLISRHAVKYIEQDKETEMVIDSSKIDEQYKLELMEFGYLDKKIPQWKLEILARLVGFGVSNENNFKLCVEDEKDAHRIRNDIQQLGFTIEINKEENIYCLENSGAFNELIKNLVSTKKYEIPQWIFSSNTRIQREFLSGFISSPSVFLNRNERDRHGGNDWDINFMDICHVCSVNKEPEQEKYLTQIVTLMKNLNIDSEITKQSLWGGDVIYRHIVLDADNQNYANYFNNLNLEYCYAKRSSMTIVFEYIKYLNRSESECIQYSQLKQNNINGENLLVKIKSIEEIQPEPVYDFETICSTHSFVAHGVWSHNCVVESPEHSNIGLVKHLSMLGSITIGSHDQASILYHTITTNKNFIHMNNHSALDLADSTKIFLNGEWIGFTQKPIELYRELRTLKTNSMINRTNGIIHDLAKGEIKVYTDSGRLFRPVLNVKDGNISLTNKIIEEFVKDKTLSNNLNRWDMLMMKYPEAIDVIDSEEQYYSLVARNLQEVNEMKSRAKIVIPDNNEPIVNRYDDSMILHYTHCEFHPSMILGIIAANIPFANHNQGPRNIFSFAQMKQAMGWYTTNYRDRADISYILYHTQKPLVNTKLSKYIHTDILPCGENAIVMAGCYSGHNQDDSIVFNQTSIDRGLFRSASLKKWSSKIEKNQSTSQDDIFMRPDQSKLAGTRHAVYDKLNDKGYVPEETVVVNGDVIIGKVTPIQPAPGSNKCYKDSSEIYKSGEPAIIDRVFTGITDSEGSDMIKMRTRSIRIPKIGDKFCMRTDLFEVLTSDGWLKLKNITLNHKIATLVDNSKLEYVHPVGIYKFNYNGPMYKTRSEHVDLDVTMDHMLYIKFEGSEKYELVEAKNAIGKKYRFKKNCDDYEGAMINDQNLEHYNKGFFNIPNHDDNNEKWSDLSEELDYYVKNLNKIQSVELLKQSKITNNYHCDEKSANDLMTLAIHCGKSATINCDGKYYNLKVNDNNEPLVENEELYDYDGEVGCLEVPSHVFMIRQNNKNVWIGNCSRHGRT